MHNLFLTTILVTVATQFLCKQHALYMVTLLIPRAKINHSNIMM